MTPEQERQWLERVEDRTQAHLERLRVELRDEQGYTESLSEYLEVLRAELAEAGTEKEEEEEEEALEERILLWERGRETCEAIELEIHGTERGLEKRRKRCARLDAAAAEAATEAAAGHAALGGGGGGGGPETQEECNALFEQSWRLHIRTLATPMDADALVVAGLAALLPCVAGERDLRADLRLLHVCAEEVRWIAAHKLLP